MQSDPLVMEYINGNTRTPIEVKDRLDKNIHHYEKYGFAIGNVYEHITNHIVGSAGIVFLGFDATQNETEAAYALLPKHWGKGYATELAQGLVQWAKHLQLNTLTAYTADKNIASQKVLLKAGFIFTGMAMRLGILDRKYVYNF